MFRAAETAEEQIFIQELETRRVKLAETMTQEVVNVFDAGELAELGLKFDSDADKEAVRIMLSRDCVRVFLLTIHGYTDWLAAKIWRKYGAKLPRKVPVPVCGDTVKAEIAARYSIDAGMVKEAIQCITEDGRVLPVVGKFSNGKIIVNRSHLARWASLYDWSNAAGETKDASKER